MPCWASSISSALSMSSRPRSMQMLSRTLTRAIINYFEQYLEAAPNAKNAGQVAYTVGALYQQAKNNAKAKEFFAKAVNDPKYGADAKKALAALK